MNIREFAEHILFSNRLEDKLIENIDFSDSERISKLQLPLYPGRPPALDIVKASQKLNKTPFPSLAGLEKNEHERGIVLHFFANHELLALELMAMALLKFPEADPRFRKGLVAIMQQEQKHMRFYIEQMNRYGVGFGDIHVNDFFWNHMAKMPSLIDFTTHMSLTFEQANIDFAKYYMQLFNKLGDTETAKVLDIVYQEEISHVAHGLHWFKEWTECKEQEEWAAYNKNLRPPFLANRAKGMIFDEEGRKLAGLSPEFIRQLRVYSGSKSRPSDIYVYNPQVEEELLKEHKISEKAVKNIQKDLAVLFAFVAQKEDIILVPKEPSLHYLTKINELGFELGEFFSEEQNLSSLATLINQRRFTVNNIVYWGLGARSHHQIQSLKCLDQQKEIGVYPSLISQDNLNTLYDKDYWKQEWFKFCDSQTQISENPFKFLGTRQTYHIAYDLNALTEYIDAHFKSEPLQFLVVKAVHSASGRHKIILRTRKEYDEPSVLKYIEKLMRLSGKLILEPWLNRTIDLSVQFKVASNTVSGLTVRRSFVDQKGQFCGQQLNPRRNIPYETCKDLVGYQTLLDGRFFQILASEFAKKLTALTYQGPVCIDMFIGHGVGSYRKPTLVLTELNARHTMGSIATKTSHQIAKNSEAVFFLLNKEAIDKKIANQLDNYGFEIVRNTHGKIEEGVLILNELSLHTFKVAGIIAGSTEERLRQLFDTYLSDQALKIFY